MMFWTIFSGNTIVKVKMKEIMVGDMMYEYDLDHGELGEQLFVLIIFMSLMNSYMLKSLIS